MGIFDGFFGPSSKIKDQQDLTEDAARILKSKGMVDPRVYDPNIKFKGVTAPPEGLKYAHAFVNRDEPGLVNLVKSSLKMIAISTNSDYLLFGGVELPLALIK